MILPEQELRERLDSPNNLLNRLRKITNPHKPIPIPALPPSSDEIIPDLDKRINEGSIKSKALNIIATAMDELQHRMGEVSKPERLAGIAAEMSKVVHNVEKKNDYGGVNGPQIIIYAPQVLPESAFNTIEVD